VLLDRAPIQAPIGDHVVEVRHHLAFGHDRQARQAAHLELLEADAGEAAGVEPCVLSGMDEEPAEPVALVCIEPRPVPAEALEMVGKAGCELCVRARPEPVAGVRRHRHRCASLEKRAARASCRKVSARGQKADRA
jgi:hypothetical protein